MFVILLTVIPVIKEIPRVVTISKTKNVVIECRIQSIFEPQCTWKKDNTVITDNVTRQTQIERVKDVMFYYNLEYFLEYLDKIFFSKYYIYIFNIYDIIFLMF